MLFGLLEMLPFPRADMFQIYGGYTCEPVFSLESLSIVKDVISAVTFKAFGLDDNDDNFPSDTDRLQKETVYDQKEMKQSQPDMEDWPKTDSIAGRQRVGRPPAAWSQEARVHLLVRFVTLMMSNNVDAHRWRKGTICRNATLLAREE
jgi:hypothetical protein